jgi:hypothetical protein
MIRGSICAVQTPGTHRCGVHRTGTVSGSFPQKESILIDVGIIHFVMSIAVFRIHRIHMFLCLQDPDPLVKGMDPDPAPDPDPSIIMQK